MTPSMKHIAWNLGHPRSGYGQMGHGLRAAWAKQGGIDVPWAGTRITAAPPYHIGDYVPDQDQVCYTMFEATRLPETYLEHIDNYSLVLVPNEYNQEQYAAEHPNVKVLPIGVDGEVWYPVERPEVQGWMRFLFIGHGNRKGEDLIDKAFDFAFPDPFKMDPIPALHNFKAGGKLTDIEMAQAYWGCHVSVQPSRGEGWNLLAYQALATGMPCILTDIPGHSWAKDGGCTLVDTTSAESPIGGMNGTGYAWTGEWWEPDMDSLVGAFRHVYQNYAECVVASQNRAQQIAATGTWDSLVPAFLRHLKGLRSEAVEGEPTAPETRKFVVDLNAHVDADIGGQRWSVGPGLAEVNADVKRVLMRAGYVAQDLGVARKSDAS